MENLIPRLAAPLLLLSALIPSGALASVNVTGQAITEKYWDCCKPDCSWEAKADVNQPVAVCDNNNDPLADFNSGSSCGGGDAYPCADQTPWAVNDTFSYGYAGVFLMDHASDAWCCACYELTFTSGAVEGQKMIVQAHNSGFDLLTSNRFTFAVRTYPILIPIPFFIFIAIAHLQLPPSGPGWKHKLRTSLFQTVRSFRVSVWRGECWRERTRSM